jgi:DNA repair photolyase
MSEHYTNPLSLTSQFLFCGLPLRLDSYRGCGFQCSFCYARYRGGNAPDPVVVPAEPGTLRRIFEGALGRVPSRASGLIGKLLRRRAPIHFGGMSDPFHPVERTARVTQRFLEALLANQHPTVISTRSTMPATEPYFGLLREMESVVVQFSFTSTRAGFSRRLEPHTPRPAELLKTMEALARQGITVTCRWQPYVPGVSEHPRSFVRTLAAAGARHVAVEHLKLPVETNHPLWRKLVDGAGRDLRKDYERAGAKRDGRELVLPPSVKLPTILAVRDAAWSAGVSFGAADNEFQYLSDSDCCCSGVDQFPGFGGWFKHQVAHAVRRCRGRRIVYGAISRFWAPEGSVDRWLNSRSRLGSRGAAGGTIRDHIRVRWNDLASPFSPASYYGVVPTEEFTPSGFRVFTWQPEALALLPPARAGRHASSLSREP